MFVPPPPELTQMRARPLEQSDMERAGAGGGVSANDTSDSLDDFYEGEGASMLLFEFILHGIFTNLG